MSGLLCKDNSSLLEVFSCLSMAWATVCLNLSTNLFLYRCFFFSAVTCNLATSQLEYCLSDILKACEHKKNSQSFYLYLNMSAFHLSFSTFSPFLAIPPGMQSRCGSGRSDCLLRYKDWGGLWGACRVNVPTTLKFVWMPLSKLRCNVQLGMWLFKWKVCFPYEKDLSHGGGDCTWNLI